MEELLAQERATEQHVLTLLKSPDVSTQDLLTAYNYYLLLSETTTFADYQHAEFYETRLWQAIGEGKKYFSRKVRDIRKSQPPRPVEERHCTKNYLEFLKQSERFYRTYIYHLNAACGGIPELEAIAQKWKVTEEGFGESQPSLNPSVSRDLAKVSCHRSLIYLGDLCRYRASEKLDRNPDFGPSIGWYGLATLLLPSSGLGHHQQAVVALALPKPNHLRAIYHLYRSIAVEDSHPHAPGNLNKEFEKINAAWDRGELIQKGSPNDPDAAKNVLVGWLVRFHSMCYKGEVFRGHEELEREALSQLANVVKKRPIEDTLQRIVLTNIGAQWVSGEHYQANPIPQYEQSFFYYFRFNLRTFTTLLQIFYDDLYGLLVNMEDQHVDLSAKLTPLGRRILPCLRLYNNWLLPMVTMAHGLMSYDFTRESVQQFWSLYAKTVDLIAQAFPIWDLEDIDEICYLLDEDAETRSFKALEHDMTNKTWFNKQTGEKKPLYNDKDVVRVSLDDEMLLRIKDFLADGLNLANDNKEAPISLRGTRIFFGDESNVEALVVRPIEHQSTAPPKVQEKPKPVSYAAAAANGHARRVQPPPAIGKSGAIKPQSRDAQLIQMVDDLVDDDDGNNPVTPPQQHASNPAVVTNGEVTQAPQDVSLNGFQQPKAHAMQGVGTHPNVTVTPPPTRSSRNVPSPLAGQRERLQSVSKLWENGLGTVSSFSNGLSTGTPPNANGRGHSRVNSASSIRSKASPINPADPWASDLAPRALPESVVPQTVYSDYAGMNPSGSLTLLFGAGGGPWSTGMSRGYRNVSPPNGKGG